jgi:hypothetical protein
MGSVKIKKIEVQCKCPICHTIHTEQWGCRPDVTPWRYCDRHKVYRGEEEEGERYNPSGRVKPKVVQK